jgi:hypothetical protein
MADSPGTITLSGEVKLWVYDRNKCFRLPIGDDVAIGLVKWSSNKIVNCSADDTGAARWALEPGTIGTDNAVLVCLDFVAIFEMKYTGTPSDQIGTNIGIADYETADFGETVYTMLQVLDYDTELGTVLCKAK